MTKIVTLYRAFRATVMPVAARLVAGETETSRRGLERVIEYLAANNTENISLQVLAQIAGVTPHHFSALFMRETGLSPHQYILRQRIERAKVYLQDETRSIGEVSKLTGFRTQEHFTKVFRKLLGTTPSKFRLEGVEKP